MSDGILSGLRVIEGSAFVAAPLGGMTLAQLGADVIRFDQVGGGLDHDRWPLAANGDSLFWAGLNKGKRSVQLDLRSDAGRELAQAIITAPGDDGGLFLTNFPARGWLDPDVLRRRRRDLVMVALTGNPDGSSEVDYTVNPATGFPWATGPRNLSEPLNSVLPAWDVAMGTLAAVGLLAAERHRRHTGDGTTVRLSLSDVAFAMVGNLGRIAEAQLGGVDSPKDGNYLYGAFGADFPTRDGRRVMVVALTARQWRALRDVTGIADACEKLVEATGYDLDSETGRFEARDLLAALLKPWFARRDLDEVRTAFTGTGVSWGPYQTFRQLVTEDPRCSHENPMFDEIEHPGVGRYLAPASPLDFDAVGRVLVRRAPALGEHTEQVLSEVLGLSQHEIGRLHDDGVVAGPVRPPRPRRSQPLMPVAIQPAETDLLLPLPPDGEQWDPYKVHTHYFGFSVPEAGIGAYLYARYQPAFPLSQGGVTIFRGMDNPTLLDAELHDYRATMPWPSIDGGTITFDSGYVIDVVEPGERILLRYTSPDGAVAFELEQTAVTPLLARGHIIPGEDDHHDVDADRVQPGGIEQFMRCTGELRLRGERFDVDCLAVRDRSWLQTRREDPGGQRPSPPLGWTPISFGPDLSVNAVSFEAKDTDPAWAGLYDVPDDAPTSFYAWLVKDGEPRQIVDVRRDVHRYEPRLHAAAEQTLEITDEAGDRYRFEGRAVAMSAMHSWPNIAFRDSVYRWTDEKGRVAHCTYQEIWYDAYQRKMKALAASKGLVR